MDEGTINYRLNNIDQQLTKLSNLIETTIEQDCRIDTLEDRVDKLEGAVAKLKEEPSKKWSTIVNTILSVTITTLCTFILIKLGLK